MKDLIFDLHNVGVCYRKTSHVPWKDNRFWALKDVSFKVYRGQTIGVIGRNGAGKSTLLKVLAGIIDPDQGRVERANVTATIQSLGAGFSLNLTGRQNIYLSGSLLGMNKKYINDKIDSIMELAELNEFIDEPIKNYSTGMRSRLGFAIAYYINTDVILIDETLAAGDQAFKQKASELIKEKIQSDHTVVIVSHQIPIIREMCDRIIHIENGKSLPEISPKETIERYQAIFGVRNQNGHKQIRRH